LDWNILDTIEQLELIQTESFNKPQLLFKHSTRCSISSMAKSRLDSHDSGETCDVYYLDLISYREISNAIADKFGVAHESPQVILLKDGKAVYNASHSMIKWSYIQSEL
jgi:bacillithiol system protein YtxJ